MFNRDGICSECQSKLERRNIAFWNERQARFEELMHSHQSIDGANYDCIIPVSGGKESYWQACLMKYDYGMNPLMVTFLGHQLDPAARENLDRMRSEFGIDHLIFGPSSETLRKLERASFLQFGCLKRYTDIARKNLPTRIACQFNIPLIVWSRQDKSSFPIQQHEQELLSQRFGLSPSDLICLQNPSAAKMQSVGVTQVNLCEYIDWDANEISIAMREKFGFQFAEEKGERAYCTTSNLEDRTVSEIDDYLRFVRNGYGLATEHACRDIRNELITRREAIQLVTIYDHVRPKKALESWLQEVNISEQTFDQIADTYRSPQVWWIENGLWWKENVWGQAADFGEVHFSESLNVSRYQKFDAA